MLKPFIITDDMVESARFTLSSICGFEITAQTARKSLESAQRVAPPPAPNVLAENAALRKIISDAAAALPNGAFIHPQASVGFMEGLPKEITLVCAALAASDASALDAKERKE